MVGLGLANYATFKGNGPNDTSATMLMRSDANRGRAKSYERGEGRHLLRGPAIIWKDVPGTMVDFVLKWMPSGSAVMSSRGRYIRQIRLVKNLIVKHTLRKIVTYYSRRRSQIAYFADGSRHIGALQVG